MYNPFNYQPIVLHIIDELPSDGAERLLADLLRHRSTGFQYRVLCIIQGGPLQYEIEALGIPVEILKRKSKYDLLYLIRLSHYIRKLQPYAVHTHLFTADSWGRVAARLAGVSKIFSTVHSTNNWMKWIHIQVEKLLANITNNIIACSDKVAKQLVTERRLNTQKVTLIPNGVSVDRLANNPTIDLYKTFNIPKETPVFALVGRLHTAKGHLSIIPILQKLKQQQHRFHCLFIGEGVLEQDIQQSINAHGLNQHITMTGFRSDIPSLLHAIDFLIMPSRWEGLPITLLEAMATHTPVIASAVGGIPSVLNYGAAGILVDPGNKERWLNAIQRMLTDKNYRQQLAEIAHRRVSRHYSAENVQRQYEQLYLNST